MSQRRGRQRNGILGTFGGVFTPSILTILGLIFFLRLGFVVGNAGVARALVILGIAMSISVLTSMSLSAIATNRKVRGGGDYYLISRSLGIAYGGALGLMLFVAQAVSAAFYCVGFGEALVSMFPGAWPFTATAAAAGAAAVLLVLSFIGADLATRFQYLIMAALAAALVSFFVGGSTAWSAEIMQANWARPADTLAFWPVFAIFFPAVTGFTQGVSMSGDLKDPGRSLPTGTFLAVGLSAVVYLAAVLVLGASRPADELRESYVVMKSIAAQPRLIDAGVLAATLSSALASFLGAPRILQALAADRVFTTLSVFSRTHGPSANPRRGVLLAGLVAFSVIALGNLNVIARLVSMFFLISYGLLNYATYVEATGASPSFRPRFRFFHRRASLAGTLLCGGVMLAIDPMASIVAVATLVAIYQYVRRTAVPSPWRDSRRAYRFRRVRESLGELAREPESPADWQPHVLAFTEGIERRERVLRFASWITGGSGVTTAVQILEGEATLETVRAKRDAAEAALRSELDRHDVDAFPLVLAASDVRIGAQTLVQAWGVGPIRANTVLLNWFEKLGNWKGKTASMWYTRLLRNAIRLQQNVVVLDAKDREWKRIQEREPDKQRIDVWWWEGDSSKLALLFAYLMTRTETWDEATLRVLVPASPEAQQSIEENLRYRLEESRIEAQIDAVPDANARAIAEQSKDASLVVLPLRIAGMRIVDPFDDPIDALLQSLPVVALVAAAQDIELGEEEEEAGVEEAEAETGADDQTG